MRFACLAPALALVVLAATACTEPDDAASDVPAGAADDVVRGAIHRQLDSALGALTALGDRGGDLAAPLSWRAGVGVDLGPAEHLLDAHSNPLADLVADVSRGPVVESGAAACVLVLRDALTSSSRSRT